MDGELIFWVAALVVSCGFVLWCLAQPKDLYYEGRMDKIGGKGGRQVSHLSSTVMIHTDQCIGRGLPGRIYNARPLPLYTL